MKMAWLKGYGLEIAAMLVLAGCGATSDGDDDDSPEATPSPTPPGDEVVGHEYRPEVVPFEESMLELLQPAAGFEVEVFATDLEKARMLAFGPDGALLVTRPEEGDVIALRDEDGDGRADAQRSIVSGLEHVHGIALEGGNLYLATPSEVFQAPLPVEGTLGALGKVVEGLPDGGQHGNRTMAFGPDGQLYLSVGSSCNACDETNPEHASLLRVDPDFEGRVVFAAGLRNTIGFAWHPDTGELWGMDHGSDWRGDEQPPEELNRLIEGADYGWPYAYAKQQVDPFMEDPPDMSIEAYVAQTAPSVLEYTAHAAPIGMIFYDGDQFPAEYRGDGLVAMHGSWNTYPPVGYKIVRIRFEAGAPVEFEDFVTGFLQQDGQVYTAFGRPAGIVQASDGTVYFSDDANGVIYRVRWTGASRVWGAGGSYELE